GTFSDADGDTLTLSATLADGSPLPSWLRFDPAIGTFSGTPSNSDVGTLVIRVTATDGSNTSISTSFGLTV
ncbi:putative Ig domain-containing protein, partial [Pectobacterium brasiliense]